MEEIDLIKEVNINDDRYKENKDINLKDCNLGQLANILDLIYNPSKNKYINFEEICCEYLNCDKKELMSNQKSFPLYKSNIIKYILNNQKEYKKVELESDSGSSVSDSNNLIIIQVGVNKTVKVPKYFSCGFEKGREKIVINTWDDISKFHLKIYYKKSDEDYANKFFDYLEKLIKENNFYKNSQITPNLEFLNIKNITWKDIFIEEEVKNKITCNIISFFEKDEIYKKNGISSKCGLILEGPPGTGKTLIGQILANTLEKITFILVTPRSLISSYDVKNTFFLARELSPSIVFVEDADLYCIDRSLSQGNSVLGEIMNQLDGVEPLEGVVTIFTSNDPSVLEKALIDRPGRFDERVIIDNPKKHLIIKMIKKFLSIPSYDKNLIEEISEDCEKLKLSGAHIKRLCDLSTIYAIKNNSLNSKNVAIIKKEHFDEALENIKNMKIKAGEGKVNYLKTSQNTSVSQPISFDEFSNIEENSNIDENINHETKHEYENNYENKSNNNNINNKKRTLLRTIIERI